MNYKNRFKDNMNLKMQDGLGIRECAPDVYAIDEFGIDWSYLIKGSSQALLFDTGCGIGNLYSVVKSLTDLPLVVVNSHSHYDHAGGNGMFGDVYAHEFAVKTLQEQNCPEYRRAFIETQLQRTEYSGTCQDVDEKMNFCKKYKIHPICEGMKFDLGDRCLEVLYTPGHTRDSICLLDRENRILYSGDTILATVVLLFDTYSPNISVYADTVKRLLEHRDEYDMILGGHYLTPFGKIYLEDMQQCLYNIQQNPGIGKLHYNEITGEKSGYYYQYHRAAVLYAPEKVR